jgi:hypothetical protein
VHTRRAAAFFLGAWIAGCVLIAYVAIFNLRAATHQVGPPVPAAERIIQSMGAEPANLLLRHRAAEINRSLFRTWEKAQFGIAGLLFLCLFLGTDRRVFPLILCGIMFAMVVFQFSGVDKELAYRGRETDFPPLNTDFAAQQRVWALHQIYVAVECVKLAAGLVLAGYLFVFRARRRRRKGEPQLVDQPDPSHVEG